eukprot:805816_1
MGSWESFINGLSTWEEVGLAAAVSVALQLIAWVPAALLHTEKFYDLIGSSTFLALNFLTFFSRDGRYTTAQIVVTVLVTVWAIRLGGFLFLRVLYAGSDSRFKNARENPSVFLIFWVGQGIWVWTTLLPVLVLNSLPASRGTSYQVAASDYIGWVIFVIGFLTETTADFQKFIFRMEPQNKGKWIDSGMWRYSRHPNYFGKFLFGVAFSSLVLEVSKGLNL